MKKTHSFIHVLTLLTSSSTLFCCALPALIVTLGAGASLAGLMSSVPQLSLISEYKTGLFVFSGVMLLIAGLLQYRQHYTACPMDPELGKACSETRHASFYIYLFSLSIYLIGFSFAYVIPRFL